MKTLRYLLEAVGLSILFLVFRMLPLDWASSLGGWIGRTIGPRLAASRKARFNLEQAMPELSETERGRVISEMWDNLGRVIAEYPHLAKIARERVEIGGKDVLERLRTDGQGAILFSAHMANWEVAMPAAVFHGDLEGDLIYRPPNNPWVRRLLESVRRVSGRQRFYPKSRRGMTQVMRSLKEGRHIGILIDQKYREGLAVPFFRKKAMTSPAFIELSRKFGCPLVPGSMERIRGGGMVPFDPV